MTQREAAVEAAARAFNEAQAKASSPYTAGLISPLEAALYAFERAMAEAGCDREDEAVPVVRSHAVCFQASAWVASAWVECVA